MEMSWIGRRGWAAFPYVNVKKYVSRRLPYNPAYKYSLMLDRVVEAAQNTLATDAVTVVKASAWLQLYMTLGQ